MRRVRLLCLRNCCENNYLLSIFIKFYKFYLHRLTGPSALPGMHPAPPESWQLGHQWMWATKWNVWWSRRIILCLKLSSRIKLLRVQIRKKRIFYRYWMILGTSLLFLRLLLLFNILVFFSDDISRLPSEQTILSAIKEKKFLILKCFG